MPDVVVTAVGADRPGIVAAITGALLGIGGNLEEVRAALLRGSFATALSVQVPDGVGPADVEAALAPVAAELGLGVWVGPATAVPGGSPPARAVVSVYGADRRGIVHGISSALAAAGANIADLSSRLVGEPPVYVLGVEVELPEDTDAAALARALAPEAARHGVELHVAAEDDEVL